MASLETGKVTSKNTNVERLFMDVGIACVLFHAGKKLRLDPKSNRFDSLLGDFFDCNLTPESRFDCSMKLMDKSISLMEKSLAEYKRK